MQTLVKGFKVEFDAATGVKGVLQCTLQEFWMQHAVGLPADANTSLSEVFGGRQGVRHLGSWIPAEITHTKGALVGL